MKLNLTSIIFYFNSEVDEYRVRYVQTEPGHYNVDVLRNSYSFAQYNTYGAANKTHAKGLIERALKEQKITT